MATIVPFPIPRGIDADPDRPRYAVVELLRPVPELGAVAGDLVYIEPGHRWPISVQRYFPDGRAVLALLRTPSAWRRVTGGREVLEALRAASAVPAPADVIELAVRRAGAR